MKRLIYTALVICASSGVSHARPPMTDAEWSSYEESEAQFTLQRFGADPETAKWGVWAMRHQPSSRCAMSASHAFHVMRGLYSGGGESMVVDHICEPEALKHDALTIPPLSPDEDEIERRQWNITQKDVDKARKEEDERHREIVEKTPVITHKCQFDYVEYPEEAQELGEEGSVIATCHFQKDKDNYWYADSCNFSAHKGTDESFFDEAKRYMTSACWNSDNFTVRLDQNGIGTREVDFSLSSK